MYEIIIKKTDKRKYIDRDSCLKEERPFTDEEIDESKNERFRNWTTEELKAQTKKIYETFEVEKEKEETSEIFRQSVEDLDIVEVIKAVNLIQGEYK